MMIKGDGQKDNIGNGNTIGFRSNMIFNIFKRLLVIYLRLNVYYSRETEM